MHENVSLCEETMLPRPLDSIRDAVFTVSPNKQYRGILRPTTPATTGPTTIYRMFLQFFTFITANAKEKLATGRAGFNVWYLISFTFW